MAKPAVSLHGPQLGLDINGNLLVAGPKLILDYDGANPVEVSASGGGGGSVGTSAAYSALPAASSYAAGTTAFATDRGPVYSSGTDWITQPMYDIRLFGARGDGVARTLAVAFPSLSLAQIQATKYPSALSLNEELNFNAVRRAIEVAKASAGGGGVIYIPAGRYIMNNASHNGTIEIPECTDFIFQTTPPKNEINFKGDGMVTSILHWPVDYGTNGSQFGMVCGDQTGTYANGLGRWGASSYRGWLEDLQLRGPGPATLSLGVKNVNMTGLGNGGRRALRRVNLYAWYIGMDIVTDWTIFETVYTPRCYYGFYFNRRSDHTFGDLVFFKCFLTSVNMAAIALHPRCFMSAGFLACYIGGGPYSIMMEANPAETVVETHMVSCTFDKSHFEYVGNAVLTDENALNGGTPHLNIERCVWRDCGCFYDTTFRITTGGRGFYSTMYGIRQMINSAIVRANDWPAGSVSIIDVGTIQGLDFIGSLNSILGDLVPGVTFISRATAGFQTVRLRDVLQNWSGFVYRTSTSNACTETQVLELSGGRATPATTGTAPLLGIAMHSANASSNVVIANQCTRLDCAAVTPNTSSAFKKVSATNGSVTDATDLSDGKVVGWAEFVGTGPDIAGIDIAYRNFLAM